MRSPGTEPLQITTNDVVELHRLIYAEREAHAAEVAGLRKHLSTVLGILPQDFRGSTFWEEDDGYFVEHQWHKEARAALVADPSPLVTANGEVVDALECAARVLEDKWEFDTANRCRAALAAYRAATGEASNG